MMLEVKESQLHSVVCGHHRDVFSFIIVLYFIQIQIKKELLKVWIVKLQYKHTHTHTRSNMLSCQLCVSSA